MSDLRVVMATGPRKKRAGVRRGGRPRGDETLDEVDEDAELVLYMKIHGALWNRINGALKRARERESNPSMSRAGFLRKLLTDALAADERRAK